MSNKSIAKNYIYNLIFQFFKLLAPLLVTPYIARVLGENGTGKYSFSYSIVTYFLLFAALGFATYAQRLVASHQGDKKQQSIDFWEIIISRLIPVSITLIIYYILVALNVYGEKYNTLLAIFSIEVIAIAFDVSFFLQGNEEFGKTVLSSVVVKLLSYICMFIFVKKVNDLWKYVLIQSLSVLLTNISMWLYIPRYIEKTSIKKLKILKHIPATLILFLPTIATSIYTSLDKTLIGIITQSDAENGNYEYAEKLVKFALTFLTSLGSVLIPRNSKKFSEGDIVAVKNNIYKSTKFVFFFGMPLMFGCILVSDSFVPWFLGSGYLKVATLMKLLSPIIIFIGLSNVFGLQYLIPSKQDKKFTFALVSGAVVNFVLNIILIPLFNSYGAAVATVIAELLITIIMIISIKNEISISIIIKQALKCTAASIIMFLICINIQILIKTDISFFIIIIVGATIYIIVLAILKELALYEVFDLLMKVFKIERFSRNHK